MMDNTVWRDTVCYSGMISKKLSLYWCLPLYCDYIVKS